MSPKELKELIQDWNIEDDTIILEPQEEFNGGIIGVTEDKCHLIYSYDKLIESLAQAYKKQAEGKTEETDEDFISQACEWLDFNTIRSLPWMDSEHRPIIIYEF